MMRTDSEILAWTAPLFDPRADEAMKHDRMDAIVGAMSCGLGGREALEAAMSAIKLELDSPPMIWRTGVQRIADEIDTGDRDQWPDITCGEYMPLSLGERVCFAAAIAVDIDRLQSEAIAPTHKILDATHLGANGEMVKQFIEGEPLCPHCGKVDPSEDCLR